MLQSINQKQLILKVTLLIAAIFLAYHPTLWLINSWFDPSYDSVGSYVFVGCVLLLFWSLKSPLIRHQESKDRYLGIGLLILTSIVRLLGQVFAINVISALTLVIDVYSIGLLLGLNCRKKPLSPLWFAATFATSLPIKRIFERTIGHGLQEISASLSCMSLSLTTNDLQCFGTRILIDNHDVLVDLPCSGAQILILSFILFTGFSALIRPSFMHSLIGISLTIVTAIFGNSLRISVLALGIVHEPFNINVMAEPFHSAIGLVFLGITFISLLYWSKGVKEAFPKIQLSMLDFTQMKKAYAARQPSTKTLSTLSIIFLTTSALVLLVPQKPLDVTQKIVELNTPPTLGLYKGQNIKLSQKEAAYFTQFGGAAVKSQYGPHVLLMVQTTAPLRHLHAPNECLNGLSHQVDFVGTHFGILPAAVYKTTDPNGYTYRVASTFVSNKGHMVTNVSEAVWIWLQDPETVWMGIQRISPIHIPNQLNSDFDSHLINALNLPKGDTNETY